MINRIKKATSYVLVLSCVSIAGIYACEYFPLYIAEAVVLTDDQRKNIQETVEIGHTETVSEPSYPYVETEVHETQGKPDETVETELVPDTTEMEDDRKVKKEKAEKETEKNISPIYKAVDETVYSTESLYIRTGPGKNYEILGTLYAGQAVQRVAISSDGWDKIIYKNTEAYACSIYLSDSKPKTAEKTKTKTKKTYKAVNETVYTTIILNVRKGPGTGYHKLGGFEKGEAVIRTAVGNNGWSKVLFRGREGYVSSQYLSYSKPVTNPETSTGAVYQKVYETVYPTIVVVKHFCNACG